MLVRRSIIFEIPVMEKDNAYYPSLWRPEKFSRYFYYLWQYIKWGDYNSLKASLNYILFKRVTNKTWISTSEMGKFQIRPNTSDFQFVNYAYESSVKNYLKSLLPQMTYFVDVGACMGEYNVWLAKSGVKCFAFEPVNYASLEANVQMNQMENLIKTYRCGLGAKQEKVVFEVMKSVTSSSHIDRSKGEGDVDIETLDNIFQDFRLTSDEMMVIKLDVEGMEGEVIDGARNFIRETENLYIIYEKWFGDKSNTMELKLSALGNFEHFPIDKVNAIARKLN